MSIYKSIVSELEAYGEKITVTSEKGQYTVRGILQPLLYKNKMYLGGKQVPSGYFDTGHYLLICPADISIPTVGAVLFDASDSTYLLKRSETVKAEGKNLYIWAVLCPYKTPSEEDFYDS